MFPLSIVFQEIRYLPLAMITSVFIAGSKANSADHYRLVTSNIHVISRAMRQRFVIPDFTNFCRDIEAIYWHCKSAAGGKVGGDCLFVTGTGGATVQVMMR